MQTVIDATNLIGDSIYAMRPIQCFIEQYPNRLVGIKTDKGLAYEMYCRQFNPYGIFVFNSEMSGSLPPHDSIMKISAGDAGTLAYSIKQKTNVQLHITDAYGRMLGVDIPKDIRLSAPPKAWRRDLPKTSKHIAISPFSRSCTRHLHGTPNKTLDDSKWENIIRYLRRLDWPIKVIAGQNDRLQKVSIQEDSYFTAKSLNELEEFFAETVLLISVDNGMAHFSGLMETKTIVLWPKVSDKYFIGPLFDPKTALVEMDPNLATPAQLLHGIRFFARKLLEMP